MTLRLLQVIPDTNDTPANMAALRHHELLASDGVEVRTLALGPGTGRIVTGLVPTLAPSARSLAAFAQLRRELRWPDLAIAVDVLPRAMLRRSEVPVVVVAATGRKRTRLVESASVRPIVRRVVVPAGDDATPYRDTADGPVRIRTPHVSRWSAATRTEASSRAARKRLGVEGEELVVVDLDPHSGVISAIRVVGPSAVQSLEMTRIFARTRNSDEQARNAEVMEVLTHAADLVAPAPPVPDGDGSPPDCLVPALVDMMATGVVPIGWRRSIDPELLVDGHTCVVVDHSAASPSPPFGTGIDPNVIRAMTLDTAVAAGRLCGPDRVRDQWSGIIDQALPSQT